MTPGSAIGKVICIRICHSLAPSTRADSKSAGGIARKKPCMFQIATGSTEAT